MMPANQIILTFVYIWEASQHIIIKTVWLSHRKYDIAHNLIILYNHVLCSALQNQKAVSAYSWSMNIYCFSPLCCDYDPFQLWSVQTTGDRMWIMQHSHSRLIMFRAKSFTWLQNCFSHVHIMSNLSVASTKHLYNICTTSAQRLWRWSNIVQMLYKCFVFAGTSLAQRIEAIIYQCL